MERKWPYLVNSVCIVSLVGDTTALVVLPPTHLFATSLSNTVFTVCMPAWGRCLYEHACFYWVSSCINRSECGDTIELLPTGDKFQFTKHSIKVCRASGKGRNERKRERAWEQKQEWKREQKQIV